jgi:hypothetical protein
MRLSRSVLAALALASVLTRPLASQATTVVVRDASGIPVSFAFVQLRAGASRVASDSGIATFSVTPEDSLRFVARRMGYAPFDRWVRRDPASGEYAITLEVLPRTLAAVDVRERANTPLARTGFYDRALRVRKGAITARFLTPEELDLRNPAKISHVLAGENFVKVQYHNGKPLLTGRARNCPMTVVLDGRRVRDLADEVYSREGQEEIEDMVRTRRMTRAAATDEYVRTRPSVDEFITAMSVAAVEMYGSAAAVPAELQQQMGSDACGLIALWTGSRQ